MAASLAGLTVSMSYAMPLTRKTLTGWIAEHTDHFTVRNGVIHNDGGTGWLRSAKPYRDFELHVSYRALQKGADSGVFFRARASSSRGARSHLSP